MLSLHVWHTRNIEIASKIRARALYRVFRRGGDTAFDIHVGCIDV